MPLVGTFGGWLLNQDYFSFFSWIELCSILASALWCYFLYKKLKRSEDWLTLFKWVGITVIFTSVWSILERFGLQPNNFLSLGIDRVHSTFGNSNFFAGFLVLILPFFCNLLFASQLSKDKEQTLFSRKFLLCVVTLGSAGIFFTGSRAGLVAYGVSLFSSILYWLWREREVSLKKIALICFSICFLILSFYFVKGSDLSSQSRFLELTTSKGWGPRLNVYKATLNSIEKSPFLGHGPGTSYQLFFEHRRPDWRTYSKSGKHVSHAHSEVLETLQEGGLLGLTIKLGFWILIFSILLNSMRNEKNKKEQVIGAALLFAFLGYFIHASFSMAPRMLAVRLPLFTMLAFVFSFYQGCSQKAEKKDWSLAFALPIFILSLYCGLKFFPPLHKEVQLVKTAKKGDDLLAIEKEVEKIKSPYLLHTLSNFQVSWQRWDGLTKTTAQLEKSIKSWIHLDFLKSLTAYQRGDFNQAKERGLYYQREKSNFDVLAQRILFVLSYKTKDFNLFIDQLQLMLRRMILFNSRIPKDKLNEVYFEEVDQPLLFVLDEPFEKRIRVRWNRSTWMKLFNQGSWSSDHEKEVMRRVIGSLKNQKFFKLSINKENVKRSELPKIQGSIGNYFKIYSSKRAMLKKLENDKKVKLQLVGSEKDMFAPYYKFQKNRIVRRFSNKREKVEENYNKKISPIISYLKEKVEWDSFQKRIVFQRDLVDELYRCLFQYRKT